ncbi:MAG: hypothetical protein K8E66_00445 [Phycisphaerales bacterium]|nr:hypothetical protein [Phycisphaerales bacterium]
MIELGRDLFGRRLLEVVTPTCGALRFWVVPFRLWGQRPLYREKAYGVHLFGCGPIRGMHFPRERVI